MGDLNCRYTGETVLCVGAHPDDIELGMGGTAAKLSRAGAKVVFLVGCVPNDYERRVAEAAKAAAIMGGELRILLPGACSRVEDFKTYELVERMDGLMKELRPAAVFTHGPGDFHKDHLTLYNVCVSALRVKLVDCYSYYPTSCRPVQVDFNPTVFVDISQEMETKIKAVRAHPSQFSARGLEIDFLRDIARVYGRMAGCRYAEGLELVRMGMAFKPAPRGEALLDGAASGSAAPGEPSGPASTS